MLFSYSLLLLACDVAATVFFPDTLLLFLWKLLIEFSCQHAVRCQL